MRLTRHSRSLSGSSLLLLLIAGVAVGAAGGMLVSETIDRARDGGTFAGAASTPVEDRRQKPSRQDRQMGAALAAAIRADEPADCRSLAPRHQTGCRTYLSHPRARASDADPFGPLTANGPGPGSASNDSTAVDWAAALD